MSRGGLMIAALGAVAAAADEPRVAATTDTAPALDQVCLYASQLYSEGAQAVLSGVSMVCVRAGGRLVWKPLFGPDERFLVNDER
jgi:hypothetical protein